MHTEINIDRAGNATSDYIAWAPVHGTVRLVQADGAVAPVTVVLRNENTAQGGQVIFYAAVPGIAGDTLQLDLPVDGSPVDFFVAGRFGRPSVNDKDAVIEVVEESSGTVLSTSALMVRIRKSANTLTPGERDRFLAALAGVNDPRTGPAFTKFPQIHTEDGQPEAHGRSGFLPWHRAFVLDLERQLQALDPSVALPYWRFDQPAPKLFNPQFMGRFNGRTGTLDFASSNPIQFWRTSLGTVISRQPRFNTASAAAFVQSEISTIALGGAGADFELFRRMEGDPHGFAHTSFFSSAPITNIGLAANDPLFFLLHANVDRLWAKWQWIHRRFDSANAASYRFQGQAGDPGATRVGHNLKDTMWPWNGVTQATDPQRPPTAPGGSFPSSNTVSTPGPTPVIDNMIDYQGVVSRGNNLGFGYDDVPFEF